MNLTTYSPVSCSISHDLFMLMIQLTYLLTSLNPLSIVLIAYYYLLNPLLMFFSTCLLSGEVDCFIEPTTATASLSVSAIVKLCNG